MWVYPLPSSFNASIILVQGCQDLMSFFKGLSIDVVEKGYGMTAIFLTCILQFENELAY